MNRSLAMILLVVMVIILLHSLYSFYHGRFDHAMIMFPLLLVCYVIFLGRGKWKLKNGDDQQQNEESRDDDQSRPAR